MALLELLKENFTTPNLSQIRKEGFDKFQELGFPTLRNEEWKFTNVKNIASTAFKAAEGKLTSDQIQNNFIPEMEGDRLVFVNGVYNEEFSSITSEKVLVTTFAQAIENNTALFAKYYAKQASLNNEPFTALSNAFAQDGCFVHVPKGVVLEKPIALYFLIDASQTVMTSPRNLFVVEENAQAEFVEVYKSEGAESTFTNAVTEIVVGKYSNVSYNKIQNDSPNASHVGTTQVSIESNGVFKANTISLKGAIIRNNLNMSLDGEHIEAWMNGVYLLDGKSHVDNHTVADHKFPNCVSHELYKGVLDDFSRGVFNGKIFVRSDAQKTNAFQSNKNILLSDTATINTKPQLEIWADDVSCSHGCTTGQLDQEAVFFLRARGIGEKKAKSLITLAFVLEAVERITIDALRTYVENIIEDRLS